MFDNKDEFTIWRYAPRKGSRALGMGQGRSAHYRHTNSLHSPKVGGDDDDDGDDRYKLGKTPSIIR
jgi:hypothetical protein